MMITSATKHTGGRGSMERPAASNRRCAESVAYCPSALAKYSHRTGHLSPNPRPQPHPITHFPIPIKKASWPPGQLLYFILALPYLPPSLQIIPPLDALEEFKV